MDNFDKKLRSKTALSNRGPAPVTGIDFNVDYNVRGNLGFFSKLGIEDFVKTTPNTTGTFNFSTSAGMGFNSSIGFDPPFTFKQIFGNIYVSLYQGTVLTTANQIYPARGTNVTAGRYQVQGAYDYNVFDGIGNFWAGEIYDTTGTSTQVITFARRWEFLDYTVGESA